MLWRVGKPLCRNCVWIKGRCAPANRTVQGLQANCYFKRKWNESNCNLSVSRAWMRMARCESVRFIFSQMNQSTPKRCRNRPCIHLWVRIEVEREKLTADSECKISGPLSVAEIVRTYLLWANISLFIYKQQKNAVYLFFDSFGILFIPLCVMFSDARKREIRIRCDRLVKHLI